MVGRREHHERQEPARVSSSDPVDPFFNPYPAWDAARRKTPVVAVEGLGPEPVYLVLSYELVERVLRDAETFSSSSNAVGIGQVMGPMIVGMDGDEHRHTRNIVVPVLDELLDGIAPKGRGYLVADVTSRFPVRVMAAILGAEADDYDRIHHWAEQINLGPARLDLSLPAAPP